MYFDINGPFDFIDLAEKLDFSVDWTDWLVREGETVITSSVWILDAGVTNVGETLTGAVASVLISVDATATEYRLKNTIAAGSKIGVRSIWARTKEK